MCNVCMCMCVNMFVLYGWYVQWTDDSIGWSIGSVKWDEVNRCDKSDWCQLELLDGIIYIHATYLLNYPYWK